MKTKSIIHDGITPVVLADSAADVEIIDIDSGCGDCGALCAYAVELLNDSSLSKLPLTAVQFGEEEGD